MGKRTIFVAAYFRQNFRITNEGPAGRSICHDLMQTSARESEEVEGERLRTE
jgi:hypothetical protein